MLTKESIEEKTFKKVPNGIAHYLEHLMFNMEDGTAFDYFSKLGSSVNAFTTYDLTCYEVYSSTYFKENLEYLLDYVQTPYFTNELVNNERGIISEEIKMYDNNPNTELTYSAYKNIFVNDNRKYLISGTIDDIKDFMFVVNDDKDTPYSFTFDEKPDGLESVASGDKVTVKYTGTISEVDPFEGKIISVEKAE